MSWFDHVLFLQIPKKKSKKISKIEQKVHPNETPQMLKSVEAFSLALISSMVCANYTHKFMEGGHRIFCHRYFHDVIAWCTTSMTMGCWRRIFTNAGFARRSDQLLYSSSRQTKASCGKRKWKVRETCRFRLPLTFFVALESRTLLSGSCLPCCSHYPSMSSWPGRIQLPNPHLA